MTIQRWVDQLSEQPLPVWRQTREALLRLAEQGGYNGARLTRALAHDPLLIAQLLRRANAGRAGGAIATLEQAAVMLGAQALHGFADALPVLEECLGEADLAALRQLQRRDFHVGYLARELTQRFRESRYEDAFFAGLLHNLGELALRAHSPRVIPQICRAARQQGKSPAEAAEAVLGFGVPALSVALCRHWRLPALLQTAVDADQPQDRRSELVQLAGAVLHAGPTPLIDGENPRLRRLGEILGEPAEAVRAVVFRAAVDAARWLEERLPRAEAELIELFPEEPADSHEQAAPAPAAAPQPEALSRFHALVRNEAGERLGVQQVLEAFTAALRDGLGFDRVMFALLTADHATLRGRFFRGVAAESPLHRFEFARGEANLFTRLIERPAAAWVHPAASAGIRNLVTPAVRAVVEVPEFVAQSIHVHGRPIGLCYADRAGSGQPLSGQEYAQFRHRCTELARHLSRLVAPPAQPDSPA